MKDDLRSFLLATLVVIVFVGGLSYCFYRKFVFSANTVEWFYSIEYEPKYKIYRVIEPDWDVADEYVYNTFWKKWWWVDRHFKTQEEAEAYIKQSVKTAQKIIDGREKWERVK